MISERDEGQAWRDRAILTWSFMFALPVALALWLLLGWAMIMRPLAMLKHLAEAQPTPEDFVMSTSVIHSEKSVPQPQQPRKEPSPQEREQPQRQPEQAQAQPSAPTEIARNTEHATPEPVSTRQATLAETLAQQNAAFSREAQQLSAANQAPISIATIDPSKRASSDHPYRMDFSGINGTHAEGIIFTGYLQRTRGLDCYSGSTYAIQFPDGHTENGDIPWTFCAPARSDPFLHGRYHGPMPLPMPGYQLPVGTQLAPQAKLVYDYWLSQQR